MCLLVPCSACPNLVRVPVAHVPAVAVAAIEELTVAHEPTDLAAFVAEAIATRLRRDRGMHVLVVPVDPNDRYAIVGRLGRPTLFVTHASSHRLSIAAIPLLNRGEIGEVFSWIIGSVPVVVTRDHYRMELVIPPREGVLASDEFEVETVRASRRRRSAAIGLVQTFDGRIDFVRLRVPRDAEARALVRELLVADFATARRGLEAIERSERVRSWSRRDRSRLAFVLALARLPDTPADPRDPRFDTFEAHCRSMAGLQTARGVGSACARLVPRRATWIVHAEPPEATRDAAPPP